MSYIFFESERKITLVSKFAVEDDEVTVDNGLVKGRVQKGSRHPVEVDGCEAAVAFQFAAFPEQNLGLGHGEVVHRQAEQAMDIPLQISGYAVRWGGHGLVRLLGCGG